MKTYGPFTSIPCTKYEHKGALKIKKKTIYMILIQFAYTDHEAKIQK